jgi:hypothetical protein
LNSPRRYSTPPAGTTPLFRHGFAAGAGAVYATGTTYGTNKISCRTTSRGIGATGSWVGEAVAMSMSSEPVSPAGSVEPDRERDPVLGGGGRRGGRLLGGGRGGVAEGGGDEAGGGRAREGATHHRGLRSEYLGPARTMPPPPAGHNPNRRSGRFDCV